MAKDESNKGREPGFELEEVEAEVKFRAIEEQEARIGGTAERIMLTYADKKPGNFLSVEFAQAIRKVAEVLHGEKPEAKAKPEAETKPGAEGKEDGELDLDAG